MLAREMRYDRQLLVDFSSQTSLQVFSVTAVALGAGVWGLAIGQVVKAVVATLMMAVVSVRLEWPSLSGWRSYGGVVRFGLSFQASWFTFVGREQGLNIVVAGLGGVTPLGIWTFTNRIFQLPSIAFNSLYVVGFPAMSNLLARGEDPREVVMRTVRRAAIAGVFVFPTFAAASPELIPSVFGGQWRDVAEILPLICLSTLLLGSIAVAATSYLSAAGRPGVVAWASAALGVVWIGVTALLLPRIGVVAIGVGNLAGAVVEATILDRATWRSARVAPHRPLLRPLIVGIVAGGVGWLVCVVGPSGILTALFAALISIALAATGLELSCRRDLHDALRLFNEVARSILPRFRRAAVDGA
jgi:O-antigen/teichoic acid export membrane protein